MEELVTVIHLWCEEVFDKRGCTVVQGELRKQILWHS